ncbi:MAG TPA: hypothetical protein DHW02_19155 [Ktedonobacter sp.]|nr:hypothetical protein [Ktedonobacter sp.]
MSRAGTMPLEMQENRQNKLLSQIVSGTVWTEATNVPIIQDKGTYPFTKVLESLEVDNVLDKQAREMNISLYQIMQHLSETIVSSVQLLYTLSFTPQIEEQDIWLEMPPRSVKNTVMNVQYMGRGEPPEFPDEFWEE